MAMMQALLIPCLQVLHYSRISLLPIASVCHALADISCLWHLLHMLQWQVSLTKQALSAADNNNGSIVCSHV